MADPVPIALAYLAARRRRGWSRARIVEAQRRGVACATGQEARGRTLQQILGGIPLTDAAELRRDFASRNTLGISLAEARRLAEAEKAGTWCDPRGLSVGLSTGSEGAPGVFITSPAERARYIGMVLGKLLSLSLLPGCRVALLLRHDNRLYADTARTRLVRIEHFDIALPVDAWSGRLCDYAPDVVIGPPSVLAALTRTAAFERRPLRPRLLLAGAEPLYPSDVRSLTLAFGVAPRPIYQAMEGFVALACPHGNLHVNEDILVAEWRRFRDSPHHAVPVITDFSRTTQRVWRTTLADVVTFAPGSCPCGSAMLALAGVEGRLGDVLYAGSADRVARLIFPFDLDAALDGILPNDSEWQIRQEGLQAITVATAAPLLTVERCRVSEALVAIGGWPAPFWTALCSRPPATKRRRFIRLFDGEHATINCELGPPCL